MIFFLTLVYQMVFTAVSHRLERVRRKRSDPRKRERRTKRQTVFYFHQRFLYFLVAFQVARHNYLNCNLIVGL
jgi:preprotein translocase subunit Sec63